MPLSALEITRFRCIERAEISLDPRCNLILGPNGSGKTSLLEACFLLGSGHSFRTHRTEALIQNGSDSFTVVGHTTSELGTESLGVMVLKDSKEYRISGRSVRGAAELATRLPTQVIDPEVHRLVEDGPTRRRQFLDWGVFHVEQRFHGTWSRYVRALRQRNAALKSHSPQAYVWDEEVVEQGEQIAAIRQDYLKELAPFVAQAGMKLMGKSVAIEHRRGWKRDVTLAVALAQARDRDLKMQTTTVGPHRADLCLMFGETEARAQVSRGQQKLLACALLLAQQMHRAYLGCPPACLLLDDPAAELDVDNLCNLISLVAEIPAQLIVTGLSEDLIPLLSSPRLFHVEHGKVREMA